MVLDLSIPVFTHGQLYTSISRVRSRSSIALILSHTDDVHRQVAYKTPEHIHEVNNNIPQTLNIV